MTAVPGTRRHPADAGRERRVEAALARLDLEDKVRLLSGASQWATAPAPGLGRLASVRVRVTNTGERSGREVVQLYLSPDPETGAGRPERPARWLVGFTVVQAGPGETAEAEISVNRRSAEIWDTAAHGWSLVPGGYEVLAGRSYAGIRLSARVDVPA